MAKIKYLLAFSIFTFMISFEDCLATPAALPYFCIIVEGGSSENLSISFENEYEAGQYDAIPFIPHKKLWETCYVCEFPLRNDGVNEIIVSRGTESFKLEYSASELWKYDNTMTLNINNKTLTPGKSSIRSVLLISIRMSVILSVQLLVFFLFRFNIEFKRNMATFLIINFLSWLIINLIMDKSSIYSSNQAMLWIGLELAFVSIVSGIIVVILMPIMIKEKGVLRKAFMGLASHFIGYFAMNIMIESLPF